MTWYFLKANGESKMNLEKKALIIFLAADNEPHWGKACKKEFSCPLIFFLPSFLS